MNISARQLTADLPETVVWVLRECALPPALLELEVTESLAIEADGQGLEALRLIAAMGVAIAIDDFGTGHSSLKRLGELPVRTVKIDRAFIEGLTSDAADAAIVAGVIAVAHQLGHRVVAEGIESPEQLDVLRDLGCDVAQGFLLGPPVPAFAFPPAGAEPVARAA